MALLINCKELLLYSMNLFGIAHRPFLQLLNDDALLPDDGLFLVSLFPELLRFMFDVLQELVGLS